MWEPYPPLISRIYAAGTLREIESCTREIAPMEEWLRHVKMCATALSPAKSGMETLLGKAGMLAGIWQPVRRLS